MQSTDQISVCICTYKRPELLGALLNQLQDQKTNQKFSYSILVVDNDSKKSAESTVEIFKKRSNVRIDYLSEPEQNISLARNKALEHATGNYVAFIDDDELPIEDWLHFLYEMCKADNVDGVLGPVKGAYRENMPPWIIKGKFFDKPRHKTGYVLHWKDTRTSNGIIKKRILEESGVRFKHEYGRSGGEDKDFFKRLIEKGYVIVWCDDAIVFETIENKRLTRGYFLRYALMRGCTFRKTPEYSLRNIIKSIVAVCIYTTALPFCLISGQHVFMKYLIKDIEHVGKILSALGIIILKERDEFRQSEAGNR